MSVKEVGFALSDEEEKGNDHIEEEGSDAEKDDIILQKIEGNV